MCHNTGAEKFMVSVAQLVEPRIVIPAVVGSSPIVHPILFVVDVHGPLAQLAEQLTLNQRVEGSNPSRPTNKIKGLQCFHLQAFFMVYVCYRVVLNNCASELPPVYIFPVTHLYDIYNQLIIFNTINNTIRTLPNSILVMAG